MFSRACDPSMRNDAINVQQSCARASACPIARSIRIYVPATSLYYARIVDLADQREL